jgi:hypothetical protein
LLNFVDIFLIQLTWGVLEGNSARHQAVNARRYGSSDLLCDACSSVSEFDIFSLKAAICINRYILLVSPTKIGEFVD